MKTELFLAAAIASYAGYSLAVPSEIDMPVNMSITGDQYCAASICATGWSFNQHKTGFHGVGDGIGGADDTFAWDVNLNTPVHDSDAGKAVYAIQSGEIHSGNGWEGNSYGQILINHTDDTGQWSSGYLHLNNIVKRSGYVNKGDIIGYISSTGGTNNHLHFAIYQSHGKNNVTSVNAKLSGRTAQSNTSNTDSSYFDGTGSLVDPRLTGSSCKRDGVGCSYDLVTLHPHSTPSSALFQIVSTPGVCESVELSGLNGGGKVEMRSWAGFGTESVYYTLDSLPATIPLKNQNTEWNLLSLTTTAPVPAGSTRTVQAKCVATRTTSSNARIISNGKPLQFGNDNYWGGNGSIMGHTARVDRPDAEQGFGRNRDSVTLMRDHSTISSIQVTRGTCSRVKFSTPVPIKVSWKSWNASNWLGSTTVSNQDFLDIPVEVGHWAILMIQAGPTKVNNSVVTASCL